MTTPTRIDAVTTLPSSLSSATVVRDDTYPPTGTGHQRLYEVTSAGSHTVSGCYLDGRRSETPAGPTTHAHTIKVGDLALDADDADVTVTDTTMVGAPGDNLSGYHGGSLTAQRCVFAGAGRADLAITGDGTHLIEDCVVGDLLDIENVSDTRVAHVTLRRVLCGRLHGQPAKVGAVPAAQHSTTDWGSLTLERVQVLNDVALHTYGAAVDADADCWCGGELGIMHPGDVAWAGRSGKVTVDWATQYTSGTDPYPTQRVTLTGTIDAAGEAEAVLAQGGGWAYNTPTLVLGPGLTINGSPTVDVTAKANQRVECKQSGISVSVPNASSSNPVVCVDADDNETTFTAPGSFTS